MPGWLLELFRCKLVNFINVFVMSLRREACDMPPLYSTTVQTVHLLTVVLHTCTLGPSFLGYVIVHITYRQSTAQCSHTTPTTSHPCDTSERNERRHARSSWSLTLSLFWTAYCSLSVLKGNGRHGCMWTHAPLIIEVQKSYMLMLHNVLHKLRPK